MKKYLFLLSLIVLLPFTAFADFGIGPVAFYNSPVLAGEAIEEGLDLEQFTFGANARLKLTLLHAEALALLSFGGEEFMADIFLDAGVAFDLAILRLSAGIGPKLTYFEDEGFFRGGYNLKLNGDVMLGNLSLGISYIYNVTLDDGFDILGRRGLLGFSLIFW